MKIDTYPEAIPKLIPLCATTTNNQGTSQGTILRQRNEGKAWR